MNISILTLVPVAALAFAVAKPRGMRWRDYFTGRAPVEERKPPRAVTYDVTLGWLRRSEIAGLPDDAQLFVRNERTGPLMPVTYAATERGRVVLETF